MSAMANHIGEIGVGRQFRGHHWLLWSHSYWCSGGLACTNEIHCLDTACSKACIHLADLAILGSVTFAKHVGVGD